MFAIALQQPGPSRLSTVAAEGALDHTSAPHLRETLRLAAIGRRVMIDLRRVSSIDAAGLDALLAGVRQIREAGGEAAVCVSGGRVEALLDLAGVGRIGVDGFASLGPVDASADRGG